MRRRLVVWIAIAAVVGAVTAACGSSAGPVPAPLPSNPAPKRTVIPLDRARTGAEAAAFVEARALVLGARVARDYRRASAIYADLCADGCGDATACREQVLLAVWDRGAVLAREHYAIGVRVCERGDPVACWFASAMGMRDPDQPIADMDALCDAGDAAACIATFDIGDTAPMEGGFRHRPLAGCRAGVAGECGSFASLWSCELGQPAACLARSADAMTPDDRERLIAAWTQISTLCDAGDATACYYIPGREIPDAELCRAGDYEACHRSGDDATACAAGLTEYCQPSGPRPTALWKELHRLQDACKTEPSACKRVDELTAVPPCP